MFTFDDVEELYKKVTDTTGKYYIDKVIKDKVVVKYNTILKIKKNDFQYVKGETATVEEILKFIQRIDEIENIDLDHERDLAKKKLSIIRLGKRYLDGTLSTSLNTNDQGKGAHTITVGHSGGGKITK